MDNKGICGALDQGIAPLSSERAECVQLVRRTVETGQEGLLTFVYYLNLLLKTIKVKKKFFFFENTLLETCALENPKVLISQIVP